MIKERKKVKVFSYKTCETDTNSFMTGRSVSLWTTLMWEVQSRTKLVTVKPNAGSCTPWGRRPEEEFVH